MKPTIVARGVRSDSALREHVLRRLRFALDRTRHSVQALVIRITDLNGPRGGTDKRCQISLKIPGLPALSVNACAQDATAAIDLAAHRAARAVTRMLERLKSFERRRISSPARDPVFADSNIA